MMKRLFFVLFIFVLAGCSSGKSGVEQSEKEINTKTEALKTNEGTETVQNTETPEKTKIHVAVMYEDSYLTAVRREFMKENQDVEIIIDRIEDYEKYIAQIVTKSMTGDNTIDLAYAVPSTNTLAHYETGMYEDFYELMKNDSDFNEDDYYMNCYEAFEYKDKLYQFPLDVYFNLVGANTLLPEEILEEFSSMQTISYDKMTDLYKRSVDEDKKLRNSDLQQTFYVEKSYDLLMHFLYSRTNFIDLDNKTCDFINTNFIDLIKMSKIFTEPNKELGSAFMSDMPFPEQDAEYAARYLFNIVDSNNLQVFFDIDEFKYFADYKPLADNNGNVFVYSYAQFNILETSKNKEICWEFMKFFNNPKIYNELLGDTSNALSVVNIGFLINKEINKEKVVASTKSDINRLKNAYSLISETPSDVLANKTGQFYQDVYESKQVNHYKDLEFSRQDALINYYRGLITAEQAAAEMQNKISIKLLE